MRWLFAGVAGGFTALFMALAASLLVIFFGLLYFLITLWIIKQSASWVGFSIDGNYAVLSASIISVGTIIGSSLRK